MTYDAEVLADAPEAYWRLGESAGTTASDSSGNGHDLTHVNSPTLGVTGLLTNDADLAITYPGVDEHSERVSFTGLTGVTSLTLEFWMLKASLPPDNDAIFGYNSTSVENELQLLHTTGGFLRWFIGNQSVDTPVVLTDGQRHHVVFRWRSSDGQAQMYVDGVLRFSTMFRTGYTITGNGDLFLAAEPDGLSPTGVAGQFWQGTLDEFALYTTYLSTGRIQDHYNAGLDMLADPFIDRVELAAAGIGGAARYHPNAVFYVPLDEDQGSGTVTDVIGGKSGTVTVSGVGADLGVAAQVGTGINFVGTDEDRVAFAADADFGVFGKIGFTVEAWVFLRTISGFPRIATNEASDGTVGWRANFAASGSGFAVGLTVNGDSGTYDARGISGELALNQWHHVVLAWDSTTDLVEVFVNGVQNQATQVAGVGAPVDDTGRPMHLGESPGAAINRNPDGIIDNFAIYHRALDAREARSSYVRGQRGKPLQDLVTGPVNHWKFDGDATDSAGLDDGTIINAPTFPVGQVVQAVDLDGSNQYVELPTAVGTALSGVAGFTFEVWIRPDSVDSVFRGILDLRRSGGGGPHQVFLALRSSDGAMQLASLPDGGDVQANRIFTTPIVGAVADWYHVAVTIDVASKEMRTYTNGDLTNVFDESGNWAASTFDGVTLDARIGLDSNGGNHFGGLIDDARIHHRVVSAAEIRANYRANVDRFLVRAHFSREMDPATVENSANWSFVPSVIVNDITMDSQGFYADFDISEIQGFEPVLYLTPGAGVLGVNADPTNGIGAVRVLPPSAFVATPLLAADFVTDFDILQGDLIATPEDGTLPEFVGDEVDLIKVFLMRAFKTTPTTGFVYWSADNEPDTGAAQAPVPPGELTDIVVEATYFRNP